MFMRHTERPTYSVQVIDRTGRIVQTIERKSEAAAVRAFEFALARINPLTHTLAMSINHRTPKSESGHVT